MEFTTEQKYGGQTAMTLMFEEVKFDVEVDDSIFPQEFIIDYIKVYQ